MRATREQIDCKSGNTYKQIANTSNIMRTCLTSKLIFTSILLALFHSSQINAAYQSKNYVSPIKRLTQHYFSTNISKKAKTHFQNGSILLTGATGGLGRSLALQFASNFDIKQLVLTGRDEKRLQSIALECQSVNKENNTSDNDTKNTIEIITIPCDLSNLDEVRKLGETVQTLSIDVFIHAGGLSSRSRFIDTDITVDQLLMNVNFLSGAMLSKYVVPGMLEMGNGGNIAFISSIQGLLGIPYRTSYAASKFAVQGYCEALRAELATSDVTVHVISPGYIKTNLSRSAITGDGSTYNKMDETTAKGADPDDVAITILNSIADGKMDFVVAATLSAKIALWLKFLAPSTLQSMLVNRYEQQAKKS